MNAKAQKPAKRSASPLWISIGLSLLLLSVGGLLIWAYRCPTQTQYLYFKIMMALGTAAFSAILSGFIKVSGRALLGIPIRATGGIAMFLVVFKLLPVQPSANGCPQPVTILLRDSSNATIPSLEGQADITVDGFTNHYPIVDGGKIYIQINQEDRHLRIELLPEKWVFQLSHTKVLDTVAAGNIITLILLSNEKYCCIAGKVIDSATGKGIPGATIEALNGEIRSDSLGRFTLFVPPDRRNERIPVTISEDTYTSYQNEFSVYIDRDVHVYMNHKPKT